MVPEPRRPTRTLSCDTAVFNVPRRLGGYAQETEQTSPKCAKWEDTNAFAPVWHFPVLSNRSTSHLHPQQMHERYRARALSIRSSSCPLLSIDAYDMPPLFPSSHV